MAVRDDEPFGPGDDLHAWREQLLASMLRIVFWIAALVALPSALYALHTDMAAIFWFDLAALTALGCVTFAPHLTFRQRAWAFLLIVFLFGTWMLSQVLVVGMAYLLGLPVLGALLLGLRPGLILLLIQALVVLTLGFLAVSERPFLDFDAIPFAAWTVITLNYVFVGAIMTLGSAMLLRRLDAALQHQQGTLESLETSRRSLESSNLELEREIASRRRAQAESARLAQVVEQSPSMILIAAADGAILYRNAAAEAVFGAALKGPVQHVADLAASQPGGPEISAAFEAHGSWQGEIAWAPADGDEYRLEGGMRPLREAEGAALKFVISFRNVTQERLMEGRLRQAERFEATGTFAGGIAHDFNNIIGAILALAEEARLVSSQPRVRESIDGIESACNRARDIVRQMLWISRGNDVVERRAERLGPLLRETLPLLRAALPASIHIDLDIASEAAARIHPVDLNQILLNLASNAAHAMAGHGAGTFSIDLKRIEAGADVLQLHPRLQDDHAYLCLRVSDTGCGIPAEHRERIFDAFFTTKEAGEGTGLGLSSVHGIVASLGGDLSVYSEPGRGTTFRIYLPEADAEELAVPAPGSHVDTADAARSGRILLVDDEQTILTMTARFLERAGYTVATAPDGTVARELLAAAPDTFDLLITDLTMPGCSGEELIEFAHGLRPELPAILTSGFGGHRRMVDELESRSLVRYLDKPYRQSELMGCVGEALARARIGSVSGQ